MKRVGKNSVALGLVMLLISAAMAFSAQGDTVKTSYAEAQFVAAGGALGALVDPLGDAIEQNSANNTAGAIACSPATDDCESVNYSASPLQTLDALLGPVGDVIGGNVGPVGNYARAKGDASGAKSGAVTDNGIVNVGGATPPGAPPANATLDLTGPKSPLNALAGVANVKLDTGALSAGAELKSGDATVKRSYNIAGGSITIGVPALKSLNTELGGVLSTELNDPLVLNATTICALVADLGETLLGDPTGTGALPIDLCGPLAGLNILEGKITGLSKVTKGLTNLTRQGVTFDFTNGEIKINLEEAVQATLNKDINSLDPNTEILKEILPSLALNLQKLVADIKTEVVDNVLKLKLEATLLPVLGGGVALPPLDLAALKDAGLDLILDPLFDGLDQALATAGKPLADALGQLVTALGPLLKVIVHDDDAYRDLISGDRAGAAGPQAAAAGDVYSETALRVQVGPGGSALDLLLANALVGPNGEFDDDVDADAAQAGDGPADNDAVQDADSNDADSNDNDAVADSDADAQADSVSGSDADAVADADVTSALPNTGSSNVLPLVLLALGLIGFGAAVLINERRRMTLQV